MSLQQLRLAIKSGIEIGVQPKKVFCPRDRPATFLKDLYQKIHYMSLAVLTGLV